MRLARWMQDGRERDGIVVGDRLVGCRTDSPCWTSPGRGSQWRSSSARASPPRCPTRRPRSTPCSCSPIRPPAVRDFVAFEEHVEGIVQSVDDSVA